MLASPASTPPPSPCHCLQVDQSYMGVPFASHIPQAVAILQAHCSQEPNFKVRVCEEGAGWLPATACYGQPQYSL